MNGTLIGRRSTGEAVRERRADARFSKKNTPLLFEGHEGMRVETRVSATFTGFLVLNKLLSNAIYIQNRNNECTWDVHYIPIALLLC